jgi:hypothetical protein
MPTNANARGRQAAAAQTEQEEMEKSFNDSVLNAIEAAAGGLQGDSFSLDEALTQAGKEQSFFNPTLSQYREGMILNTDESVCKIKKTPVGNGGREAWVIVCPCGHREGADIVYDKAFNFYPSTLRKTIQVTDENGDAVLDENKQPKVVSADNAVFQAAQACTTPKELINYAMNKVFEVGPIKRDFGPSVFVKMADNSNKATSHKLTSAPSFTIIG